MLRDNYKKAFSQINPSEATIERIFEMTEKKRSKKIRKGLIIAIALVATLVCGALTANAATDGALFEDIARIMVGEEVAISFKEYIVNHKYYVDENGNKVDEYVKIDLNDHIVNHSYYVDEYGNEMEAYAFDTDGDGISDHVYIKMFTGDSFEKQDDAQD